MEIINKGNGRSSLYTRDLAKVQMKGLEKSQLG